MDTLLRKADTALGLVINYLQSVPAHSWLVLGAILAAACGTFIAVNVQKASHLKREGEKIGKRLVQLYVLLWGFVASAAAFITTHGTDISALSAFAPFIKEYLAPVMTISTFIYTYGGNGLYLKLVNKLKAWAGKKPSPLTLAGEPSNVSATTPDVIASQTQETQTDTPAERPNVLM